MRRAAVALIAAGVIGACAGSNAHQTASVSHPPSQSPAIVVTPTPMRSASPGVPLKCTLPAIIWNPTTYSYSGGFIAFPSGTFTQDPAAVIKSVGDGELDTVAQPVLRAYPTGSLPFYDLAMKRWVPQGPGQASPDGRSYAYGQPAFGGNHWSVALVTVATGGTRYVDVNEPPPAGQGWQVEDYDGRYVYLVGTQVDQFPRGVWRFDPSSGALQQLLPPTAGNVLLAQNGVAWLGLVNPADPSPPNSGNGQGFDTVASVNLSTGAQTTWIYKPGDAVIFWGLDSSGHPVVQVVPPGNTGVLPLVLVDTPGGDGIAIPAGFLPQGGMEADLGRLWFGGPDGIYYWTLATGLQKVYSWPDQSQQQTIAPAGHCV